LDYIIFFNYCFLFVAVSKPEFQLSY